MNKRFLTWRELTVRLGVSKMTIWRMITAGLFPSPVRLGPRRVAFPEKEIAAWEATREKVEYGGKGEAR